MRRILIGRHLAIGVPGLLMFLTIAAAEPPQGRPGGERRGPRTEAAPDDDVRQAMEQMVIARMTEALRLSEEQEAKVVPRVRDLMQARREHAAKRRSAMARLRGLLQDETAGDEEIGRAVRDVKAIEDDFRVKEAGLRDAVDRDLTPRQRGRMVFFEARLRRVMQRRVQDTLGGERGLGPRRGVAPPPGRRPGRPGPVVDESPEESDEPEDEP